MTAAPLARIVIFARPEDPAELRDLLQQELGLNPVDAGIASHHAPGLVPRSWPIEVAQRTSAAVSKAGLKSIAVPVNEVPDLGDAETVHHVRCTPAGLALCNLAGNVDRLLAWERLQLISVGRVPLDAQRHYVTDNLTHLNPVPPDEYLKGGPIRGFEAWLLFDAPRLVIRCDSEHMNYEYLGDRKTASGASNFDLLLADISKSAQGAFLTPATRKLLTRGPVLDFDFNDSAALQEYTLTEYCLSRELRPH